MAIGQRVIRTEHSGRDDSQPHMKLWFVLVGKWAREVTRYIYTNKRRSTLSFATIKVCFNSSMINCPTLKRGERSKKTRLYHIIQRRRERSSSVNVIQGKA